MKNLEALDRLNQSHSAQVVNLFWIAVSNRSEELRSFLSDLDETELKALFPDINGIEDYMTDAMTDALVDYDKYGFLAEVSVPRHYNFNFDGDQFLSCSVSLGITRHFFVYADDIESLLEKIESGAENIYQEYILEDKSKKR